MEEAALQQQETAGSELAIGNNVKKLLEVRGESISQFSRDADLSWVTASDLYHGRTKSISFEVLERLCDYFGVGPSELFPYLPEKKKKRKSREDEEEK